MDDMRMDESYERLQASDPAREATVDSAAIRAKLDARLASDVAPLGIGVPTASPMPDELAARRAVRARRRPWLAVAAAACLVAVGGGGYLLGNAGGLGGADAAMDHGADSAAPASDEALPPIALGDGLSSERGGGAEPARDAATGVSAESLVYPYYGHTVYADGGVSGDAGSAMAYGFDSAANFTKTAVERLAGRLGVAGSATQQLGAWTVAASDDGTKPSVSIYSDAISSFSYYNPGADAISCVYPESDDAKASDPDPCVTRDTGTAPTADEAIGNAKELMTSVGVDPSGYEFSVQDWSDGVTVYVQADQVIEGRMTSLGWSFQYNGLGLNNVNGFLAPTIELGEYDTVSAADGVARLGDPRFGASFGGVMPLAAVDGEASSDTSGGVASPDSAVSEPTDGPAQTPPAAPQPGAAISWPVTTVTLTSATLALGMQYQADGSAVLAPAWSYGDGDGNTWNVIAVAESRLDFSPAN